MLLLGQEESDAKLFANVFWAIGNLIQFGKGFLKNIDEDTNATTAVAAAGAINNNNNNASTKAINEASIARPNSLKTENVNNTNNNSTGISVLSSMEGSISAVTNSTFYGIHTKSYSTNNSNNNNSNNRNTKNTSRLLVAGVAERATIIMTRFINHEEVIKWGCRAINNMSKSNTLKAKFIESGALETINLVFEKYNDNRDVSSWAILAKETLFSSNK
jgi:hypothetical protein